MKGLHVHGPMERFPKSLISFQRMFPDEAACAAWLSRTISTATKS